MAAKKNVPKAKVHRTCIICGGLIWGTFSDLEGHAAKVHGQQPVVPREPGDAPQGAMFDRDVYLR